MATAAFAVSGTGVRNSADATTGWSVAALDTELQIEGTGCIGQKTGAGVTRYNHLTTPTLDFSGGGNEEGEHVFVWFNCLTFANLDTVANGGIRGYVGNDAGTNFREFTQTGHPGDGYFGGWTAAVFDPTGTPDFSGGTPDETTFDAFGITINATAGIMGNFVNVTVDQITIGFGIEQTAGDTGTKGSFQGFIDADPGSAFWGMIAQEGGVFLPQCKLLIGDGVTTTVFEDLGKTVVWAEKAVAVDFFEFKILHEATCTLGALSGDVTSDGCTLGGESADALARPTLTVEYGSPSPAGTLNAYATTFQFFRRIDLNPDTTCIDCTFRESGTITANGAQDLRRSNFAASVATSTLVWNEAWDTDGILDGSTFTRTSDTVSSPTPTNHAIEFTAMPASITITDCEFNGYATVNGSTGDEVFFVNIGSGTYTINIVGGSGTPSVRTAGATVNIVQNPVTATVNAVTTAGVDIQNIRVRLEASDALGDLPYQESVTITMNGSTAEVTHTGHGLADGQKVIIRGANESELNGVKTITNAATNSYDFVVSESPSPTTATGTITSTGCVLEGLTDINGEIADTRSYSVDQNVVGVARKGSDPPRYRTATLTGTIDKDTGATLVAVMILDE